MSHSAGSGDRLARGAVRATFSVRDDVTIDQKKWDEMFADFDPEKFKNEQHIDPEAKKADAIGNIAE